MAEKNTVNVTAEDKEMPPERRDEMRAKNDDIEVRWKQMQDKMNEMELKVNNMDQLTKDLDGIKANLNVQTERINDCERQLKEGLPDMKMVPMLEEMRDEMEKMKVEQTRLAQKANDDSEAIYTTKGKADAVIQLLEQQDDKYEKKLNEHKTNMNTMMDDNKTQLEDVKTTIASMSTGSERQHRALEQMESKLLAMINDLQKQYEWVTIMKQFRNDERRQETEQSKLNGHDLVVKVEKMEGEMHMDGDELHLNMDNPIAKITKQLETIYNRVTENENKLAAIDTKVTTMGNEAARMDNGVATDDNEITTINNDLVSIKTKVAANVKRATTTDKKVDAIKAQITDIDKEGTAIIKRMTWMENWQKKIKNIGPFGTLSQRNGCLVSEFTFTVKNIGEEYNKAIDNEYHCIESEPFYTNIMGYRVKIIVCPNDHNLNHVGVYLILVKGKFDDSVSWPFICKYEFSSVGRDGTRFASYAVNPKSGTDCIRYFFRPHSKTNNGPGTNKYIEIQTLLANKDKYLIDGGLKIKTTIWLDI